MNKNLTKKIAIGVVGILIVILAIIGFKSMFEDRYEKRSSNIPVSTAPVADRMPAKSPDLTPKQDDTLATLNFIADFAEEATVLTSDTTKLIERLQRGERVKVSDPLAQRMYKQSNLIAGIRPSTTMANMHSRYVTNGLGSLDAALDNMETDPEYALTLIDEFIFETGVSIDEMSRYMN